MSVHNFVFPDIPEAFPLKKKMLLAKNATITGQIWDVLQVVLSVVACIFYVVETFVGGPGWEEWDARPFRAKQWLNLVEVYITCFFAIDFFLNWYIAQSRLGYLSTPMAIIDVLTIVPLAVTLSIKDNSGYNLNNFAIFRFVRILRLVRILRTFRMLGGLSGVRRQVITLCLTLASLIFLAAGIIHVMENDVAQQLVVNCDKIDWDPSDEHWRAVCDMGVFPADFSSTGCDCDERNCMGDWSLWQTLMGDPSVAPQSVKCHMLTFFDCFYFIVVTISTVGYGDINPSHEFSKMIAILFIGISVVIIPIQANKLSSLLSMGSVFRTPYTPTHEESHIIVCGFVNDRNKLERFFKEFFHPDRSIDADFKAIVLCPNEPCEEVRSLLVSPVFDSRVVFMVGSALKADDLQRARADIATAIFFLSNAEVSEEEARYHDASTVLETLSVSNYK
jgi:hypothetical protein